MDFSHSLHGANVLAPGVLMATVAVAARFSSWPTAMLWKGFQALSVAALALSVVALISGAYRLPWSGWAAASVFSLCLAALVQGLGTVIGSFSSRYLQGEAGQRRYIVMLAAVLACVHLLLLADHWLLLIAAWAGVGLALQHLLCFYPDRPFARLAALKKRIADRLADALLLGAAALAWLEVGSGALSALWLHIAQQGMGAPLHASAVMLVLAVVLRTALLPVHGWLIQVMEAPTPVSALLHAGVVNLGGFVLIRFAPLLEHAAVARGLLLAFGLVTAVLAGMVMLTRITIKVRLAWSTVAQMGFMLLECALGLYTLAALHLIGHSLYKAHAFLSASTVVRQTRLQALHSAGAPTALSVVAAPVLAAGIVLGLGALVHQGAWPWWWSALLGLAWAPLLWMSGSLAGATHVAARGGQLIAGMLLVAGLTLAAYAAHLLPLGLKDAPHAAGGPVALAGMAVLYIGLALLQTKPPLLERWRRWSYAGFYVDEAYTRWALQWWPARWVAAPAARTRPIAPSIAATD
ncbi:NADH-quinone oxidoreductase subunit L [Alicycliphilus denitrificans]|uniref:Probable inorganic carbon transporter subunit DabB n=1 Tax=Alicycliphilus denitrificans (strain DSM 14773 / CIP 107495 / K601) TaxID=596154 RepID=F4G5R9_ALIDK|nr:NADH-quinone oxidoreductase subunit L [Alicycliphilus denitrificans]AEB85326.1 NADH/Ubiquinone/plastoquinone (complex I) [Alicycliphilus denitrificans K601]MBS0434478.1 NADH-quinone oxidoreductase subunit L [Pseudomonadota bacterium]